MIIAVAGKITGGKHKKEQYEEFKWSSFSLCDKLPEPKSNMGKDVLDTSDSLSLSVGNTEKDKNYVVVLNNYSAGSEISRFFQ